MPATPRTDPDGWRPSGSFVWRTPLLPVGEFRAWGAGLTAADTLERAGTGEELDAAVATDRATLRQRLAAAVERAEIRDAVAVAAPKLEAALDAWLAEPTSKRGRGIERGLVRYLTRMATRPTPFGLFAGVSTGELAARTSLALGSRSGYRRRSQIDTDVLSALADHLARDPGLRDHVTVRPNDSAYRAAGSVRYVQARQDGPRRAYQLASLPDHPAVRRVLDAAGSGARVGELVDALVADGYDAGAARRAVDRLVDRQALVADLGVDVTGPAPLGDFIDELADHEPARAIAGQLAEADDALAAIDAAGLGAAPELYHTAAKPLADLPGVTQPAAPFHVVLAKPARRAWLGPNVIAAVQRAVTVLHAQTRPAADGPLEAFRDAFVARYDTREVPLVEALDGEAGIGYGGSAHPSPLLRGVAFPAAPAAEAWTPRDARLLERLGPAIARGDHELALGDDDIEALAAAGDKPALPRAIAVVATLCAQSGDAADRGGFRLVVEGAAGPSGARLLGRFCHVDADVRRIVDTHVRAEEAADPDAVHAEVVHLPAGREGNVVLRPVLRDLEIPYLGRSGAPPEQQVPITDLVVSVREGRVLVRSHRLGRRVEPRLTSAHNAARRSLPLYRFLFDVQHQGVAGHLAWDWGPLRSLPFLPRVTHGELVLFPSTWRVDAGELAGLAGLDDGDRFAAAQRWRAERGVPRTVHAAQFDQRLVVDFANVLSVDSLVHLARQHADRDLPLILQEAFLADEDLVADGPEGRFAHELVVPLVRPPQPGRSTAPTVASADEARRPATPPGAAPAVTRRFPPGSSWLYAKLFAGPTAADAVLTDVVAPWRARLREAGVATGWYFLRLGEPAWHLRVRLHGDAGRVWGEGLAALQQAVAPLLDDGRMSRLQLDTYEREIEALGGPDAIVAVEAMFEADSDAAADIVAGVPRGDAGLDARWRLALLGMHRALLDLGCDLDARHRLLQTLRADYASQHRADVATKRELGRRFRAERGALDTLVDPHGQPPADLAAGVEALTRRSAAWSQPLGRLRRLEARGQLTISWPALAERVLHLHANRLLRCAQRRQEYVLYDFLARLYEGHTARGGRR